MRQRVRRSLLGTGKKLSERYAETAAAPGWESLPPALHRALRQDLLREDDEARLAALSASLVAARKLTPADQHAERLAAERSEPAVARGGGGRGTAKGKLDAAMGRRASVIASSSSSSRPSTAPLRPSSADTRGGVKQPGSSTRPLSSHGSSLLAAGRPGSGNLASRRWASR